MLKIWLREAGSDEEIFNSVAWIRAFNINEPIYAKLCHEFYSTYEFDEVCVDDELQTKKIIKFRLGGCLRSDEHFNAQDYWLSISREENLGLSRSHTSTVKKPILRVIHEMITYGLCQRTTGFDKVQKNDLWLLTEGHLTHEEAAKEAIIIRISRKFALLEEERPIIETMAYNDKYKKILDDVCKDKVELDGKIVKEKEDAVKRIKGEALKEKDKHEAFIFPIRLEGQVNKNALADTGSDINTMSYEIYKTLGKGGMKKVDRGITMINHTQAEAMGFSQMFFVILHKAGSDEEIFTSVTWIRAVNINDPIYAELCHEFYSTYEFDELCADDELQTKKIIKFRLGGRAHNLTLLEFARRLGLYQAVELKEEGFNVYFKGGLRNDEHFNAQDYWLSISREENFGLSWSHTSTIRSLILRVIHKMITYGLCQRTTGYDKIQKNDLWRLSMFDARHQNRNLDTITFRNLTDSDSKLIPEDPQLGVPRVGIPRPPRASM
nr:hypothetical protein [Tanacetum cinerariifolium]